MRLLSLLFLYGGLALGGLWLAKAQEQGRLDEILAALSGTPRQAVPSDPEAIRRLIERDLHGGEADDRPLPPPGSFLDENGLPRLDPASLKRFLEEATLLQERIDQHRQMLDEKIRAATH